MKRKIVKPGFSVRVALTPARIVALQVLASEPRFGEVKFGRDDEWWEEQYQQKLTGGFRKSFGTCKACFVRKSRNGSCNCS